MLRTTNAEPTLWDAILPEAGRRLPPVLVAVDELLGDPRFFAPFAPHVSARFGRPSIRIETYLRMRFLHYRYKLGFEALCAEVSDSLAWRRFCRIPLDAPVPQPTTVLNITCRCSPAFGVGRDGNSQPRSFPRLRGWSDSPRASISTYSASLRVRVVGRLRALSR
jgi:hypothetical protein